MPAGALVNEAEMVAIGSPSGRVEVPAILEAAVSRRDGADPRLRPYGFSWGT